MKQSLNKSNLFFCFFLGIILILKAQTTVISGVVTGESDFLSGVNILVKGTLRGTQTNFDGKYSIKANKGEILIFSYIGMRTVEVKITGEKELNVKMKSDNLMDEVVVVAYDTAKRESFTGAFTMLNTNYINKTPVTNAVNVIDGASVGVRTVSGIGQPGSSPQIQIRGAGSINASTNPLFVVDGAQYVGSFSSLNPNDIESISILKDAVSTSLYGSRGANGVVIITTKKGNKGKGVFRLDFNQGIVSRAIPDYNRVSVKEYYPLMWEVLRNELLNMGKKKPNELASKHLFEELGVNLFDVPNDKIVLSDGRLNPSANLLYDKDDLDWSKVLQRKGIRSNMNFSYGGANDNTDYFISLGYLNEEGYVLKSDFERISSRINVNTRQKDYLKLGVNLSATSSKSNSLFQRDDTSFANPFFTTRYIAPIYPIYEHDDKGNYVFDYSGNKKYTKGSNRRGIFEGRSIVEETLLNVYENDIFSFGARSYAEFRFFDDFTVTLNAALDKRFLQAEKYRTFKVGDGASSGGDVRKSNTVSTTLNYSQLLGYKKNIRKHSFSVLLGHESFEAKRDIFSGSKSRQNIEGNIELVNFLNTIELTSYAEELTREGYFSNISYIYDDKYYLSGSYRKDASSRFEKYKWGSFYSFGIGWGIDKENFLNDIDWLNKLKVRASYGQVGNDFMENYYSSKELYKLGYDNGSDTGVFLYKMGNEDLTWEKNIQKDIALEFGLLDNRISGVIEYYNRESKDLLFKVPLPISSGFDDMFSNEGSMVNQGVEIDINFKIIKGDKFNWSFNWNGATLSNKITDLPEKDRKEGIIKGAKKLFIGKDIHSFWLKQWYGVDPKDGLALYLFDDKYKSDETVQVLSNGTKVTSNAKKALYDYSGTALPTLFGSFGSNFSYKNLEFDFTCTYQIGGVSYDSNYKRLMGAYFGENYSTDILKRWKKPGDITDVPRLGLANRQNPDYNIASSRWLVKSDFLALRKASISFNLPQPLISDIGVTACKIYVAGENMFTLNARKGLEINENFEGLSSNRFSPSKIISLGVKMVF